MSTAESLYGKIWNETEYIIVLHYYYKYHGYPQHADSSYIQDVAKLLGRTPHSILYRLQNYASIDPEETTPRRKGKVNISQLGSKIFNKWSIKKDSLKDCAEVLLRDAKASSQPNLFNDLPTKLPKAFKKYELLDQVGHGAFGEVFSCLDTITGEEFAIKIIDKRKLQDQNCLSRFRREIRALKSIKHPNVITIFEDNLEKEKDYPGFVMEIGRHTLSQYLRKSMEDKSDQRPILKFDEALCIFKTILDAVEALHSSAPAIIHRDINPNNIIQLYDGKWVLADFSLAKFLHPEPVSTTFATQTSQGMGTPYYVSPEQYQHLKYTDQRTDIYSIGMLMWELFSSAYPPPQHSKSGLSEYLDRVFQKAIEWEQDDRYQSVRELRDNLGKEIKAFSK